MEFQATAHHITAAEMMPSSMASVAAARGTPVSTTNC